MPNVFREVSILVVVECPSESKQACRLIVDPVIAVSILVVVECPSECVKDQALRLDKKQVATQFQSLLWWNVLLNDKKVLASVLVGKLQYVFQSLLWWNVLLNSTAILVVVEP